MKVPTHMNIGLLGDQGYFKTQQLCHVMPRHSVPFLGARYRHETLLCCESLIPIHILVLSQQGLSAGNFSHLQKTSILTGYTVEPV